MTVRTGYDRAMTPLRKMGPPQPKEVWKDTLPTFGASKVPEREGHGYDYCHTSSLSAAAGTYLRELYRNMLRASGNNF